MRISKLVLIVLVSILSLTMLAQGILAATSTATITFEENTSKPPILDPDDGSIPDPPTPGLENGPLSLDYVTNLEFGTHGFSAATKSYNSTILKPFIQVTDNRVISSGWDVTVSASEFTNVTITDKLEGAYFEFKNGEVLSELGVMSTAPTTEPFKLDTNGVAKKFFYANSNEGRGSWITRWYPNNPVDPEENNSVTLTVIGATMRAEAYTTTLTWTLTDAP